MIGRVHGPIGSEDLTGAPVAGSILSAHLSQIKTKFNLAELPVSLDGQDTRFSPWRPGFNSRTGKLIPPQLGRDFSTNLGMLSSLWLNVPKYYFCHNSGGIIVGISVC